MISLETVWKKGQALEKKYLAGDLAVSEQTVVSQTLVVRPQKGIAWSLARPIFRETKCELGRSGWTHDKAMPLNKTGLRSRFGLHFYSLTLMSSPWNMSASSGLSIRILGRSPSLVPRLSRRWALSPWPPTALSLLVFPILAPPGCSDRSLFRGTRR